MLCTSLLSSTLKVQQAYTQASISIALWSVAMVTSMHSDGGAESHLFASGNINT